MYPSLGRKKNCTPLLACSAFTDLGSVGASSRSADVWAAVPVNVLVAALAKTLDVTSAPSLARSGTLKYS